MNNNQFQTLNERLCEVFQIECTPIIFTEQESNTLSEIIGQFGQYNIMYGKKHTTETKQKMSESLKKIPHIIGHPGKSNGMYGKTHTDSVKKKLSEGVSQRNKALLDQGINPTDAMNNTKTCPHCNKTTNLGNFGRWHGDRCKFKQ